jgi:hypothetical protein
MRQSLYRKDVSMFKKIVSYFKVGVKHFSPLERNRPTQAITLEEALWTSLFHGYHSVRWEQVNG